jgi:hypothetical protein
VVDTEKNATDVNNAAALSRSILTLRAGAGRRSMASCENR